MYIKKQDIVNVSLLNSYAKLYSQSNYCCASHLHSIPTYPYVVSFMTVASHCAQLLYYIHSLYLAYFI